MKWICYIPSCLCFSGMILLSGCNSESRNPLQGEWKVVEVNQSTDAHVFMDTAWRFNQSGYAIEDFGKEGEYELGTHDGRNTIVFVPSNPAEVEGAGIYMLNENDSELVMKIGNAENDRPNFPDDFSVDPMWYDLLVLKRQ